MNISLRNDPDRPATPAPTRSRIDDLSPGAWTIESGRSSITFSAKLFLGLSVKGKFKEYDSSIVVGPSADESSLIVSLRADSVATGIKTRDKHLRAGNVFDAANFPYIEFHSRTVSATPEGLRITGDLRIRDAIVPLTVDARQIGDADSRRFGGSTSLALEHLGFTRKGLGKVLTVEFDVELKPT